MKAQRNMLQNQITKNKPRGKGKTKDKNITSEHGDSALLQKLLASRSKSKGDTEGNKTREKKDERTGRKEENTQSSVKLNLSLIFPCVLLPCCHLQMSSRKEGGRTKRQPKRGACRKEILTKNLNEDLRRRGKRREWPSSGTGHSVRRRWRDSSSRCTGNAHLHDGKFQPDLRKVYFTMRW